MQKTLPIFIIAILVTGGASFYSGMKYANSKTPQRSFQRFGNGAGGNFQGMRQGMGGGARQGAGFVAGEILSKDDKSITVKMPDGGSKIIYFSDSTKVSKSAEGSKDDLETGKNVMINGSANQDGSIAAENIQIRPEGEKIPVINKNNLK